MPNHDPMRMFWTSVVVAVIALGVAWTSWKSVAGAPANALVAVVATVVFAAAMLAASRVLVVSARAARKDGRRP